MQASNYAAATAGEQLFIPRRAKKPKPKNPISIMVQAAGKGVGVVVVTLTSSMNAVRRRHKSQELQRIVGKQATPMMLSAVKGWLLVLATFQPGIPFRKTLSVWSPLQQPLKGRPACSQSMRPIPGVAEKILRDITALALDEGVLIADKTGLSVKGAGIVPVDQTGTQIVGPRVCERRSVSGTWRNVNIIGRNQVRRTR